MLHNSALMSRRLILALALSLALHGGLLLPDALKRLTAAPSPPALQAILRLPPRPEPPAAEPLLKNTLDAEEKPAVAKTLIVPPAPGKPAAKIRPDTKREVEVAQKKLSQYVFYPESARARGIEGTSRICFLCCPQTARSKTCKLPSVAAILSLTTQPPKGLGPYKDFPVSKQESFHTHSSSSRKE